MDHLGWVPFMLLLATVPAAFPAGQETYPWTHIENVPGGTACAARLPGNEVNTMIMLDNKQHLILVAGRADWSGMAGSVEIALRIDGIEITRLQASSFNNLVMLPISDNALLKRLKVARDLYWYLPSGTYHAIVPGLGNAMEWIHRCEQNKNRN